MPPFPTKTFALLSAVVLCGTAYSVLHDTYLDTSNPLLTHLPHHLHHTHYFASKRNPLNVWFTKKLWGWVTLAFLALFTTSPPHTRRVALTRVLQFLAATAVWLGFTGWFFGPALLERLIANTGGECVVHLPSGAVVSVPADFCYSSTRLSPDTHPTLFNAPLLLPGKGEWAQVPRLRRGHDVSGHLFLLTMAILVLSEQLRYSFARPGPTNTKNKNTSPKWPKYHTYAFIATLLVLATAFLAAGTTSVYFHTPLEKFSGFGACYPHFTSVPSRRVLETDVTR